MSVLPKRRSEQQRIDLDYSLGERPLSSKGNLGQLQTYLGFCLRGAYRGVVPPVVVSLDKLQLTLAEFGVLVTVNANPEAGLGEIADLLQIDKGNFAPLVARLQRRGFVSKKPSKQDGRRHHLSLTPNGVRLLARAVKSQDLIERRLKRQLGAAEHAELMRLLDKVMRMPPISAD